MKMEIVSFCGITDKGDGMEYARQRYILGHFNFTGRRLSKDVLDGFRIDSRAIRRDILVS
jgi:hypothetical protein